MYIPKSLSIAALAAGLSLVAVGCGCGNAQKDAESTGMAADVQTSGTDAGAADGATTNNGVVGSDATGDATSREGAAVVMDGNEIHIHGSAAGTPAYNERFAASKDVRGFRAQLMAELETIRTRLKDGTRPADEAKKDQAHAADLAQGLERMDRLIKAVEESDDLTWTSVRESSLKEAGEVRVWAIAHGFRSHS